MAKIMLVDDNIDIVETLKIIIEHEGHQTITAKDGEEFLSKLDDVKPDLVLLDVMMPGLTTRQIIERLREKGMTNLKIILVTVLRFTDQEKSDLMKDSGILDFVTKPFDVPDLVKKVNTYLPK